MSEQETIITHEHHVQSSYPWLETIMLIDDVQAESLSDWVVGYFHCKQCGAYRGWAHKLPPKGSRAGGQAMTNDRNRFWHEHAHGDGRIVLLEKITPQE